MRAPVSGWAMVLALTLLGCADPHEPGTDTEISGKVTLDGQLVRIGAVVFTDGKASSGTDLQADGNYKLTNAPIGTLRVAVVTPMAMAKGNPKFIKVPPKYQDPNTSELTVTTVRGANTFDIPLKSK
jgi:hypothetical protein